MRAVYNAALSSLVLHTEEITYVVGNGRGSKGPGSILERSVVGAEDSATLAPCVFPPEKEFRKSAHFAAGENNISPSEWRGTGKFMGDIRKRVVVWGGVRYTVELRTDIAGEI